MIDLVRARAYDLLGSLLLGERDALARARTTEPLSGSMRRMHDSELAAAHYSALSLEAFPYAGVYSQTEALVGGRIADQVSAAAHAVGLDAHVASDSPDHVGHILRTVGALLRVCDPDGAVRLVRGSLLPWLAPWAVAAMRQEVIFWPEVVELSLALVGELVADQAPHPIELAPPFAVSESVGIARIAQDLTVPVIAGAFVGRGDIRELGRRFDFPTGFGTRVQMLKTLMRSAADQGRGSDLLAALANFFDEQADQTDALVERIPGLGATVGAPWSSRARDTATTLRQMDAELSDAQDTIEPCDEPSSRSVATNTGTGSPI